MMLEHCKTFKKMSLDIHKRKNLPQLIIKEYMLEPHSDRNLDIMIGQRASKIIYLFIYFNLASIFNSNSDIILVNNSMFAIHKYQMTCSM